MKLTIITKNYTVSEKLNGIILKKLSRIEKYFDEDTPCNIVCSQVSKTMKMEVSITQRNQAFRAEATSNNMYVNIDLALAKIEKQIIKNKERLRSILKKESLEDRKFAYYTKMPKFVTPEVMKNKAFDIKELSVEEAELALETLDHSFFVYANPKNGRVNIMYKRTDGHVGIIEINNAKKV